MESTEEYYDSDDNFYNDFMKGYEEEEDEEEKTQDEYEEFLESEFNRDLYKKI